LAYKTQDDEGNEPEFDLGGGAFARPPVSSPRSMALRRFMLNTLRMLRDWNVIEYDGWQAVNESLDDLPLRRVIYCKRSDGGLT